MAPPQKPATTSSLRFHLSRTWRDSAAKTMENSTTDCATILPQSGQTTTEEGTAPDQPTARRRMYFCKGNCAFKSFSPREYLHHRRSTHDEKINIYECPYCVYASKQTQKLDRHVWMIHNKSDANKVAETSENDDSFLTGTNDQDSVDSNGPTDCSAPDDKQMKKRFYCCKRCDFVSDERFKYSQHLKSHSLAHLKCDVCDYSTNNRSHLERHKKNHGGSGEYKCDM